MGTPLPVKDPGEPCSECWGSSKRFGRGDTPKFVLLNLFDMQPGQQWTQSAADFLLKEWKLSQDANACNWSLTTDIIEIFWRPRETGVNSLNFNSVTIDRVFNSSVIGDCFSEFPNQNIDGPGVIFIGGTAKITFIEE